ncbi:MAG: FAD-linked oxidase C-terminal domain-containing protein [Terriglobia bacterium]
MANRKLVGELRKILGDAGVLWKREELLVYEYDASITRALPDAVVFPRSTEDVIRIALLTHRLGVPLVGRGAGTGLSGGALAPHGGVVVAFSRMNRILEIDLENLRAVVQPGVVNLDLTKAVEADGYYFAPDPSSQKACTLGGNVAQNAGGPHTLAYGVTTNHVLGLEVVLADGNLVWVGGKTLDTPGYDLTGVLVGSEGTLGIMTKIVVRLCRSPEAVKTLLAIFETVDDATETVADTTARGITPAACEMLDAVTLKAVEAATEAGYPLDAAAVLLIEVEGLREAVEAQAEQVETVCRAHAAREVRRARTNAEREKLWQGRKNAFGALGRLTPNLYVQDGVIPRTKLPAMLRTVATIGARHRMHIGNVFHAGDGNLHPVILFDARDPAQLERAAAVATEIMRACIELGGSITGEHGVGMEKNQMMPLLFSEDDLEAMAAVKRVFNPAGRLNPAKLFPTSKTCGEIRVQPLPVTSAAS